MNILEVIKSGRPFRRRGAEGDFWSFIKDEMITHEWGEEHGRPPPGIEEEDPPFWTYIGKDAEYGLSCLSLEDLLAEDWEIHEPTLTITRQQLDESLMYIVQYWELSVAKVWINDGGKEPTWKVIADVMARKLGFYSDELETNKGE